MRLNFSCEHCDAPLRVDGGPGNKVDCNECSKAVVVPSFGFEEGSVLGGFVIESKLDQGGMGEVYLSRQVSLDREVALKILSPELAKDTNYTERFINEAQTLAKMRSMRSDRRSDSCCRFSESSSAWRSSSLNRERASACSTMEQLARRPWLLQQSASACSSVGPALRDTSTMEQLASSARTRSERMGGSSSS